MKSRQSAAFLVIALTVLCSCASEPESTAPEPEAISLLGQPLYRPVMDAGQAAPLEENLQRAQERLQQNPNDPEALIWVGRRTAYLGRYREAIDIFTQGVERFPDDPRFLRHRGHRYITVRDFDSAITDLGQAAEMIQGQQDEVEPDGIPNARNQPTSTTQSNIWYHLGLAQYLKGDFEEALESYRSCLAVSRNDDMKAASIYWLYLTLRRLERDEEAARLLETVHPDMDIIENHTYLKLLLLFKGELGPDEIMGEGGDPLTSATAGYGIGAWHLLNGRRGEARKSFQQVTGGEQWAAFGFIAAEAELARG